MHHLTFSQALDLAESQARSTLDPVLAERLSCAVSLVKDGRVFQASDGSWQVDSTSREGLVYTVNGTCSCDDVHYNKPSNGLCKHRLSVYLARRVQQLLDQPPAPVVPTVVEPWPDNDVEPAPKVVVRPGSLPTPLPEAPASVNVRVTIGGRECQLTLRDHDETRLLERLQTVLKQYPVEPKPSTPPQGSGQGQAWCKVHNVQMQWNAGREGRKGWHSHRTAEGWCKGR